MGEAGRHTFRAPACVCVRLRSQCRPHPTIHLRHKGDKGAMLHGATQPLLLLEQKAPASDIDFEYVLSAFGHRHTKAIGIVRAIFLSCPPFATCISCLSLLTLAAAASRRIFRLMSLHLRSICARGRSRICHPCFRERLALSLPRAALPCFHACPGCDRRPRDRL